MEPDEEEDPLGIKELALNYDYLIFKINDYMKNLSDTTFDTVSGKETKISQEYFKGQLNLEGQMSSIDELIKQCDEIELEFMKLDQLGLFVNDFKGRLAYLEREFSKRIS